MIRLTNLADYAVVLMCEIASTDNRVSAHDLAASTNIPLPTVSKILNALGRGKLLMSHRGLKGGFALARSSDEITTADIIEAIDGPIALTHCTEPEEIDCGFVGICGMRPKWQVINRAVRDALADVKLSTLIVPDSGEAITAQFSVRAENRANS
jgi:FeS assembly SUF system regulator